MASTRPTVQSNGRHATPGGRRTPPPFPVVLKLDGRRCLVVGAGREGEGKIAGLLSAGAAVQVVAPRATRTVREWARQGRVNWAGRPFEPADLTGAFLVVVATPAPELNHRIYLQARRRGVLCNVIDDPPHCDFYYPAVMRRGALQIAISTDGRSPALAQRLRRELEERFGPDYEAWLDHLGRERAALFRETLHPETRRQRLHALASDESFRQFIGERRARSLAAHGRDAAGIAKGEASWRARST